MNDSPDDSSENERAAWVPVARPSAWAERIGALGGMATLAMVLMVPIGMESVAIHAAALGLAIATWVGGSIAAARAQQRRAAQGRVGADGITLVAGGAIARDALESAELITDANALIVRGRTRDGHAIDLEAASIDVALSWLETLGLGVEHRVVTVDAQPSRSTRSHRELRAQDIAAALGLGALAYAGGLSMLSLLAASAGAGLLMRSRTTLRIGADGVEQIRGRARRFHAFDEIAAAEVEDDVLVLRKRDGTRVVLDVTARGGETPARHRAAIAALIQRALHRQQAPARAAVEASLARREDDAATWASTLGAARPADGYRHAAVDRDRRRPRRPSGRRARARRGRALARGA